MAIPPWTIEMLRRGLGDVARKAREPETIEKLKSQAGELLQDLPQTAARGLDAVMRTAESGKKSVQRWTRKHTTLAAPMLNATGVLINESGSGVPLAQSAFEIGCEIVAGDCVTGEVMSTKLSRRIDRCLPGTDHCLAVAHRFDAALGALAMIADQRSVVLHRGHAIGMPGGIPLPTLLADLMPDRKVSEVGGSNRISLSDFDGFAGFLTVLADAGDRPLELFDFGDRDVLQAVVLPVASVSVSANPQIPSAVAMLNAGADCVVMPGDGVAGGPACGLILGRRDLIEKLRSHRRWRSLAASDAVTSMMLATLESASAASSPLVTGKSLPIENLLFASEENLRGRAERLATRMRGHDAIESCQVTAADARLTTDGRWRLPSRQIRLRHRGRSAQAWCDQLCQDVPAVFTSVDGEDLVVDLRWIAAADDVRLAEAIAGTDLNPPIDVKHD